MSVDPRAVAQARQQADGARQRFIANVGATKRRVSPTRFKEDALIAAADRIDHARLVTVETVRRRPALSAAIGGTLAALILWRPARALWRGGRKATQAALHHIEQRRRPDGERAPDTQDSDDQGPGDSE